MTPPPLQGRVGPKILTLRIHRSTAQGALLGAPHLAILMFKVTGQVGRAERHDGMNRSGGRHKVLRVLPAAEPQTQHCWAAGRRDPRGHPRASAHPARRHLRGPLRTPNGAPAQAPARPDPGRIASPQLGITQTKRLQAIQPRDAGRRTHRRGRDGRVRTRPPRSVQCSIGPRPPSHGPGPDGSPHVILRPCRRHRRGKGRRRRVARARPSCPHIRPVRPNPTACVCQSAVIPCGQNTQVI